MATADFVTTVPEWTAVDLTRRFGPIPLSRIVMDPPPGSATPEDVTRLDVHRDTLCELIDGTLVRKSMGAMESYLAVHLATLLNLVVRPADLGIVLGEGGTVQLPDGSVRIPDVCFSSWQRVEGSEFGSTPIPRLVPDLAVEVISVSNTPAELQRRLDDYFSAGVRLVWYIDPRKNTICVYQSATSFRELSDGDTLDAGDIIPGFSMDVGEFFRIQRLKK